jgi:hypothetical protein
MAGPNYVIASEATTALVSQPNISDLPESDAVLNVVSQKGIDYMSAWHAYDSKYTTDEILNRDFTHFKNDGIDHIGIYLYWYRLEGNKQGDYTSSKLFGDAFLENIKRVIKIANQHDIKVMVTISTLWGADSPWCTPDYVIDPVTGENQGLAVIRDPKMRQAFLDTFTHTVNYLKETDGIWCWALNEPWYYPRALQPPFGKIDQKENFISLFQEMKTITKSLDGRPFTIQFPCAHATNTNVYNIFGNDWNWDPRIFDATDFISFSANPPSNRGLFNKWKSIVESNVTKCSQNEKKVWIAQTSSVGEDNYQNNEYSQLLAFMKNLPLDGIMAWQWRGDAYNTEWAPPGTGSNLCADSAIGEGRPAYNMFVDEFKTDKLP